MRVGPVAAEAEEEEQLPESLETSNAVSRQRRKRPAKSYSRARLGVETPWAKINAVAGVGATPLGTPALDATERGQLLP